MTSIINCSQLEISHDLMESCHFSIDSPRFQHSLSTQSQTIPEFVSFFMMEHFSPLESTRGLHDQIILTVVNDHVDFLFEERFNYTDILPHKIFIESLIDVRILRSEFKFRDQLELFNVVWSAEEGIDQHGWVWLIFGDVINIDSSTLIDNVVQSQIKGIMQLPHFPIPLLVCSIHNHLLHSRSLLIVNQPQVISVLSNLAQNDIRIGKAITDANSSQILQESIIVQLFVFDLFSYGWSILSCITFSKDEERMISSNSYFVEASFTFSIEFSQGVVEVVSNIAHIMAVDIWMVGICKTQAGSDWLINKDDVIVFDPGKIIFDNFVRSQIGWLNKMRAKFHEVSQLA